MTARNTTKHRIRTCDDRQDEAVNHLSEGVAYRETINDAAKRRREYQALGWDDIMDQPHEGGRFTDYE
jgi:hypothetical protein